jgi:hypothetical protein
LRPTLRGEDLGALPEPSDRNKPHSLPPVN